MNNKCAVEIERGQAALVLGARATLCMKHAASNYTCTAQSQKYGHDRLSCDPCYLLFHNTKNLKPQKQNPKPPMTGSLLLQGEVRLGRDFLYGAQQCAYAVEPWETVNYADCHDGQTLFDQVLFQLLLVQLQHAQPERSHVGPQMHGHVLGSKMSSKLAKLSHFRIFPLIITSFGLSSLTHHKLLYCMLATSTEQYLQLCWFDVALHRCLDVCFPEGLGWP